MVKHGQLLIVHWYSVLLYSYVAAHRLLLQALLIEINSRQVVRRVADSV